MTQLAGARAVLPDRVAEGAVVDIRGDRLAAVGKRRARRDAVDLAGAWVIPGLVDLHCHGGGGASFDDRRPEPARTAAAHHLAAGTTTILASLATNDPRRLRASARMLAGLVEDGTLAGLHLEGPFLSAARSGAHDPHLLRAPDVGLAESILRASRDTVRQVTLAPELPGSLELIEWLTARGVVVAIGHTDCDYGQAWAAYDAGARLATHLFNGMRPIHHRDPGPAAASLARHEVVCELIGDNVHMDPAMVFTVFATIGPDRVALVSDAMAAAGAADGDYRLGAMPVRVRAGVARLAGTGSIAGSTASLADVLRATVMEAGVDVVAATRSATLTPATCLGLADEVGALVAGRRADLVVLDDAWRVLAVMKAGRWVAGRAP